MVPNSALPAQANRLHPDQEDEFDRLSKELAEKELELATLENELSAFERRYTRVVGVLFARLDFLDREIAREQLRLHPEEKYRQGFQQAEAKAQATQQAVDGNTKPEEPAYKPTEAIKNLYRKVAKTIHPDLAMDEAERRFRTDLMARANAAYKKGDKQALEQILYEWEHRDEMAFSREEAKETDRMERMIAQVKHRIKEIEAKLIELKKSDLHKLMLKVEQAEWEGRDFLAEMAKDLQRQVDGAEYLLNNLRQQE